MTDVVFDNGYEADAWREIRDWERKPDARLGKLMRVTLNPVGKIADVALKLPVLNRGTDKLGDAMRNATTALGKTVDVPVVLTRTSSQLGRPVGNLLELQNVDLRTLDGQAKGLDRKYIAIASASGGAAGATSSLPGGSLLAFSALGADVLATTTLLLRAIAAYGTTYGRDMTSEAEAQFAVGLLSLGTVAAEQKGRQQLLTQIHAVGELLHRGASWDELRRNPSVRALQLGFDQIGARLTRRKLSQVIPFLGIAAGGTLGAALADHTCQGAYMQYRRRYLVDKYPGLLGG